MRAIFAVAVAIAVTSCGTGMKQMSGSDWQAQKMSASGKKASVVIGRDIEFSTQIIAVDGEMLMVKQNENSVQLPEEVVTRIRFAGSEAQNYMLIGGGVGLAAGAIGGYFVGAAAGDESGAGAAFHPLSMVVILGSTLGGGLIGSSISQSTEYNLGNKPVPFVLSTETGAEIGGSTISTFGLFDNLTDIASERLVQMTIFKLKSGKYILVYDVQVGSGFQVRWKVVDQAYIDVQRAKLNVQG